MKRLFLFTFFAFAICAFTQAQTLFEEDFDAGSLPAGWTNTSNATDGGWNFGSPNALSSQFFGIEPNGSAGVAATNDDDCNCDKSNDFLATPPIDLTGKTSIILSFEAFYLDNSYQGAQENATVEISKDGGATWQELMDLEGDGDWALYSIDLSAFANEPAVQIGFRYEDDNGWVYGFALDNIEVKVPPTLEVALSSIKERAFGEVGTGQAISGQIYNAGVTEITSMMISYSVDDGTDVSEVLENISIPAFSSYDFTLPSKWTPSSEGTFEIMVSIDEVNGTPDEVQANNLGFYSSQIYAMVDVPNRIPEFLTADPEVKEISGANSALNGPTDLAFFPILGRNELWVINQRTEASGGSTVTISDATDDTPSNFNSLVDGNAWHFMSLPTALAFSDDNFNFASSPGVRDANHSGGTFTGPTLWSSDLAIYAQPSGGNGSHLDMLHGSPFSMGIAHEIDNVFWVYDDFNSDIVRYDFVEDHGPGADDHSDAIVRRFKNIGIESISADIPNHMKIDKSTGWLYFVDNGNKRVMRLDINSGAVAASLPLINEPLAEHSRVDNFTTEEIINTGLEQPCGLEIFENYLLIGDYSNGDILVYDMDNDFALLGSIATGNPGLTGLAVGPDGNIWYTNVLDNRLNAAAPGVPSSTVDLEADLALSISPNPSNGAIKITSLIENLNSIVSLNVINAAGKNILTLPRVSNSEELDLSAFPEGLYLLSFKGADFLQTRKLVISK